MAFPNTVNYSEYHPTVPVTEREETEVTEGNCRSKVIQVAKVIFATIFSVGVLSAIGAGVGALMVTVAPLSASLSAAMIIGAVAVVSSQVLVFGARMLKKSLQDSMTSSSNQPSALTEIYLAQPKDSFPDGKPETNYSHSTQATKNDSFK